MFTLVQELRKWNHQKDWKANREDFINITSSHLKTRVWNQQWAKIEEHIAKLTQKPWDRIQDVV